jgi:hypothetical protein
MRELVRIGVIGLTVCAAVAASAGESSAPSASGPAVLNNGSYLRSYLVYRTPVYVTKEGETKVPLEPQGKDPKPLADYQSPPPPAGWFKPEFDDSAWDRQTAPVEVGTGSVTGHNQGARFTAPPNSIICLRWKFTVEDPGRAQDLRLSLEYVGGAAVYVNGQELVRGNLPAGELKVDTLAEKYPDDLHCLSDGSYLQPWKIKDNQAAFDLRYRKLPDVAIPGKLLVKGANVLAVEIHRAPMNEAAVNAKRIAWPGDGMYTVPGMYAYAGLKNIALTSAGGGATPNVARPKGVQVWNVPVFGTVTVFDYGDPGEPLPVNVAALKNSVFSGRLVVSSDAAIRGLKATASDLKDAKGGGTLPASAVRVRYAEPAVPEKCWTPPERFNGLMDTIPAEIPVSKAQPPRGSPPGLVPGAVAPLWFTVRVPKDAKAGKYEGTITVEAAGLSTKTVPLRVTVNDWGLPDPKDFRQHHFIFLSQEAVAKHYGVPFWSEKHMALMGKSMDLLAEVNSREVPMNLGINFYGGNKGGADSGNSESMVRWVKGADGKFTYDFSVFDKYCDLVAKHYGKPLPMRINCWGESDKDGKNTCVTDVTVVEGDKLGTIEQPPVGTEESYAFWKPVTDEALKKMKERGWLDVTAFGHSSYCYNPKPQVISIAKKLWPEGVWSYTAHNGVLGGAWGTTEKGVSMPVKYSVCVWTEAPVRPRGAAELLKPRPGIWCNTERTRHRDWSPLIVIRHLPEEVISRGMDGVGDFGSDLFPIKKEKGNGFYCLGNGRGTGGPNDAQRAILAPGPDGAVATERFENFREGTQISEAILYLERMLAEKKISGDLEARVGKYLTERGVVFIKFWYDKRAGPWDAGMKTSVPGQVERDAQLLELCAEVAAVAK